MKEENIFVDYIPFAMDIEAHGLKSFL